MGYGVTYAKMLKKTRWFGAVALAIALAVSQVASPVHASNTGVHVYVDGPQLAVTNVSSSGVTVSSTPFSLRGSVRKLNQIRLYIDGNFATIIPLDQTATTFQYDLTVSPGQHVIELIGVGNDGPIPGVSFSIDYQPPTSSPSIQPKNGGSSPPAMGGLVIGPTIQKSTNGLAPLSSVPGVGTIYSGLLFLDILQPGGGMGIGVLRLVLLVLALVLLVFARVILILYRNVRYGWLGWRRRPLPAVLRRHPLAFLRLVGLVLLIAVICLV